MDQYAAASARGSERGGRSLVAVLVAAATIAAAVFVASPALAADGSVTGTVYQDFNDNGVRDAASGDFRGDTGVAGVGVTATDSTGTVRGVATTAADGTYSLSVAAAATTDVRIEFTPLPAGFRSARIGADSGSTVQFVSLGATGVDLGVTQEGMVRTTAGVPRVVVPTQRSVISSNSTQSGPAGPTPNLPGQPALFGFGYGATGDPAAGRTVLATQAQIGTTWGTANYGETHVFSGASFRRGTQLGPSGLGAVYVTDATTGSPNGALFVSIPNAGTDPRPADLTGYDWYRDTVAYSAPGRVGLGDIEISEDQRTLYAVNLNDRKLYAVPLAPGATSTSAPTAGTPEAIDIPLTAAAGCAQDRVRPFGLGTFRGNLYVTLTCTGPTAADLRAWVIPMDEDTRMFGAPVLEAPLNFSRALRYSPGLPATSATNNYRPWVETFPPGADSASRGPTPIASSVVFDAAGNMSLSIKDRSSDQNGATLGSTTASDPGSYGYIGVGDLLRACVDGAGTLVLENDGGCGAFTSTQPNNNWGLGGGKFYETTFFTGNVRDYHGNTAVGSALQIPGYSDVMATTIDPVALLQDGVRVFRNSDGRTVRGASLTRLATTDGGFGKAGGLGDLSTLVAAAPVEIGDRIWRDLDRGGTQDAGEPPIAGVTVRLYTKDGALVATAVTDADGGYRFSSSPGTSTASAQYGLALNPETDYEIRLDDAADFAPTGPLAHLGPTTTAAGPSRAVDSNGVRQSPVLVTAPVRTPSAGSADHTFDVGFVSLLSLGNRLWFDDGPDPGHTDNGIFDDDETPVVGARIELLDGGGAPVRGADGAPITTTTDADGFYRFDDLVAGAYRVRVAAENFAAGAVLAEWRSSTGASSVFDAASNDRDKGEDAPDPAASGVTSGVISLAPGLTGDGDSGATGAGEHGPGGDALDNLTVDFSFVPLIDLTIDKTLVSGAGPYRLGDEVVFELVAGNDGPGTALSGFTVSDRLPIGLEFVSASGDSWSDAVVSGAEITVAWLGDDLAAGDETSSITVIARVTSTAPGSLRNVAVVEPSVDQPDSERIPVGTTPDRYENGSPTPSAGSPSNNDDSADVPILAPTLSLGNRLWFDTGADANTDNGRYDVGEQPVVGAIVELLGVNGDPILDADGAPVAATTDADGFYRFDELAPGQYRVRVAANNFSDAGPLAHHLSSTGSSMAFDAGSNNRDKGEDTLQPSAAGVTSAVIDLQPGVTGEGDGGAAGAGANGPFGDRFDTLTADFGFVPGLSLGNRLWFDAGTGAGEANNGIVDDGEAPVVGAVVELLDAAGDPFLLGGTAVTSSTDANGYYRFDGLPPGEYRVRVSASNFQAGAPLQGWFSSTPTSADEATNNADKGVDSPNPAITGILSGVVSLSRVNPVDDVDAGATAAAAHGPGGDAADLLTVDFGFTQAFAVGDVVWLDDDGDGRRDAEEQPVAGVLVTLMDADGNPVTDLDGVPVPPVRTDAEGRYVFDGLPPGLFTVSFTDLPAGLQLTRQGVGDALGDSNPARDGVTPPFILGPGVDNTTPIASGDRTSVAQRIDRTIDAGLIPLLAVGDHVWIDADRDGRQDADEMPVSGVTVTLLGADGSPALDADGAPVAPVETDAAGHYVFDGLAPGDYRVRFAGWPAGYHPTVRSAAGVSSADDSNPDVTGVTPVVTLRGGAASVRAVDPADGVTRATRIDTTIDLGIAQDLFAVGDVVWFDADADGRRDAGEKPVSGVTVTLRNADGTSARDWRGAAVAPVKTGADGRYVFDGLLAGDYYVLFTDLPAGYRFTASGASGDGDSNPASSGRTPVFSLGSGSADMRVVTSADGTILASFINATIDAGLVTILPATGAASSIWMVVAGILLLLFGSGLIGIGRRRRQ